MTVVNSLLGRVHLSGRLDLLNQDQLELISSGMRVYKSIRSHLKTGLPFWPLGLPTWHDDWLALGINLAKEDCYLSVWRRGGSDTISLPIHAMKGRSVKVNLLYPENFQADAHWDSETGTLSVGLSTVICARLFLLQIS